MDSQYENEPDARLAQSTEPSLFRNRYRALSREELELHDAIKAQADVLARLIAQVPRSSYGGEHILVDLAKNRGANITLSLRHLEDAVYRAIKALTA